MDLEEKVQNGQSSSEYHPTEIAPTTHYGTLSVFEFNSPTLNWSDAVNKQPIYFRKVEADDAGPLQAAMSEAGIYDLHDAARRLAAGREGFVGEILRPETRPLIVTYGWVAWETEPLGATGCAFAPPYQDAYLYDFATLPDYRGQGFYPALLRYMLQDLAARQVGRAWIGTEPGNLVSAKSIARAGFTKIAHTLYLPATNGNPARFELIGLPDTSAELLAVAQAAHVSV